MSGAEAAGQAPTGSTSSAKEHERYAPHPPTDLLTSADLYDANGMCNTDLLQQHFIREGRLAEEAAIRIIRTTTELLLREPTLLQVATPVTVCGDIHGQYYDLMELFKIGGSPQVTNYMFLGDYVDRGYFSIECVLYLWALKAKYKSTMHYLRGNHECRWVTESLSFKRECQVKYSERLYDVIMESFDCLPLAARVDKQFLCVHGGLSPEVRTLRDIWKIDRFKEPPSGGAMEGLLWADPARDFGREEDPEEHFTHNTQRGCSVFFSYAATQEFLRRNNLRSLIRAHEVHPKGHKIYPRRTADGRTKPGFPPLVSVFSAPNYMDRTGNQGAIMRLTSETVFFREFSASPHPFWLPYFENAFVHFHPLLVDFVATVAIAALNAKGWRRRRSVARTLKERRALTRHAEE